MAQRGHKRERGEGKGDASENFSGASRLVLEAWDMGR